MNIANQLLKTIKNSSCQRIFHAGYRPISLEIQGSDWRCNARVLNDAAHHGGRDDTGQRVKRAVDCDHRAALRHRGEFAQHRRAHHVDRALPPRRRPRLGRARRPARRPDRRDADDHGTAANRGRSRLNPSPVGRGRGPRGEAEVGGGGVTVSQRSCRYAPHARPHPLRPRPPHRGGAECPPAARNRPWPRG